MSELMGQPGPVEIKTPSGIILRKQAPENAAELFRLYRKNKAELEQVQIYVPELQQELETQVVFQGENIRNYIIWDSSIAGKIDVFSTTKEPTRGEIAYWLDKDHRGRGIAAEAIDALAGHLFAHSPIEELWASVNANNQASKRTLEKAGFLPVRTYGSSAVVFQRSK